VNRPPAAEWLPKAVINSPPVAGLFVEVLGILRENQRSRNQKPNKNAHNANPRLKSPYPFHLNGFKHQLFDLQDLTMRATKRSTTAAQKHELRETRNRFAIS
jgi:hypothetical protein